MLQYDPCLKLHTFYTWVFLLVVPSVLTVVVATGVLAFAECHALIRFLFIVLALGLACILVGNMFQRSWPALVTVCILGVQLPYILRISVPDCRMSENVHKYLDQLSVLISHRGRIGFFISLLVSSLIWTLQILTRCTNKIRV